MKFVNKNRGHLNSYCSKSLANLECYAFLFIFLSSYSFLFYVLCLYIMLVLYQYTVENLSMAFCIMQMGEEKSYNPRYTKSRGKKQKLRLALYRAASWKVGFE